MVTLRTVGWKGKLAAEICSERVLEVVAKFLRSTEMLRRECLESKLKSRMFGLAVKVFISFPIGSRLISQVIDTLDVSDLDISVIIHP